VSLVGRLGSHSLVDESVPKKGKFRGNFREIQKKFQVVLGVLHPDSRID